MVSWRVKRQLVAVLIILGIFAGGVLITAYRLRPVLTCTDNKKNQGEIEIDCGGPCGPCELKHPKPVTIFWTRAVSVRPNVYDVVAEIQNENKIIGSPRLDYEFTLSDDLGPVARKTGTTFLLPKERTLIVETNLETTRQPVSAELRINDVGWKTNTVEAPHLIVEKRDYKIKDENGRKQSVVEASIVNNSSYTFRSAEILFEVSDTKENVLGISWSVVENIKGGEKQEVIAVWPYALNGDVQKIDVRARVNTFDPEIIVKPQ